MKPTLAGFMHEGIRCPKQHEPECRARPRSLDRGPFSMASQALPARDRHPSRFGLKGLKHPKRGTLFPAGSARSPSLHEGELRCVHPM